MFIMADHAHCQTRAFFARGTSAARVSNLFRPEFNPDFVLSNLEKYLTGACPALAQCRVLKKT
jgi:hypothetical protein